jgi:cell division protein FtsN
MKFSLCIFVVFSVIVHSLQAQSNDANGIVAKLLQDVANGKLENVKESLPNLAKRFPKESAVLYLQASCTNSMDEAIQLFSEVVRTNPLSPFADDALFSLFQLAISEKELTIAKEYFTKLQKDYSNSPFLVPAYNVLRLYGIEATSEPPISQSAVRGNEPITKTEEKAVPATSMFPKKNVEGLSMPKKPVTVVTETPKEVEFKKTEPEVNTTQVNEKAVVTSPKTTQTTTTTKPNTSKSTTAVVGKPKSANEPKTTVKPKDQSTPSTTSKPKYVDNSSLKGFYFLQAGSFKNKEVAEKQLLKFKPIKRRIIEKKKGENYLYIIALGKYSSKEAAAKAQPTVEEQCKCQTFIIQE